MTKFTTNKKKNFFFFLPLTFTVGRYLATSEPSWLRIYHDCGQTGIGTVRAND